MIWSDTDEENGETADDINEDEFSQFNKENFRFLTFSEFDQFEKASLFYLEQDVPEYHDEFDLDFIPLNFLTSICINTKKGKINFNSKRISRCFPADQFLSGWRQYVCRKRMSGTLEKQIIKIYDENDKKKLSSTMSKCLRAGKSENIGLHDVRRKVLRMFGKWKWKN